MTASIPKCKKCKTSGPIIKAGSKKKTKKEKEKPKMGAKMDPTTAWWVRDGWIKRRTNWMWRLRDFVIEGSEQCNTCAEKIKCHRIPLDEGITTKVLKGEDCPAYKSMWNKILGEEEEHDWGF